ncbi:MAG: pilus assembly PilX N-terminal domain-containing protein [Planctomycetota bacterium]
MKNANHERRTGGRPSRRGSALITVTFLLTVVAVLSATLVSANVAAHRQQRQMRESLSAMYASEAGLGAAVFDLEHGGTGDLGNADVPATFGSDSYWVDATDLGNGFVALESTGRSSRTRTCVELIVQTAEVGFYRWAAFGDEGLTMDSNAFVDSYNSTLGTYDSQDVNSSGSNSYALQNGDVGSNADITMDQNSMVQGDAIPGPDGTFTAVGANTEVSGSTTPAPSLVDMPPLDVPVFPPSPPVSVGVNGSLSIGSGDYYYPGFQVGKGAEVTIVGPATIVTDYWDLSSNSQVIVDATNGGVEIYVINDFVLSSNMLIHSLTDTPADVSFYLQSDNVIDPALNVDLDEVDFESNAKLYGTIYAPNAAIAINSNFELFGSIVARSVHLDSNSRIHFDESLLDGEGGGDPDYSAVCWRVRPVSPAGGE